LGNSLDLAKSGDTLQAEIQLTIGEEVNRQVAPLKDKAEKMIGSIDTVLTLMSGFLDDQTQDNFAEAFSSIKRSFEKLEETITVVNQTVGKTQGDFESIMKNVASITENLKNNGEELDGIFSNLEAISDSLSKVQFSETFASLKNSLETTESVLKKINEGDGSMAQLINNPELYEQLEQSSLQLNKLLKDIRYNPNRYIHFSVFGSSKTYTEEEIEEMENAAKEDE
jgi:phospholipid/cholesterol/gamma-HCH transport system substrate-binding protein